MAIPTTRNEFKEFCLRKLGKPVININVDDTQVEDRIDEALKYYADYHYDGTEKTYFKYQLTQEDIDNGYIEMPENIIGVVQIFDTDGLLSGSNNVLSFEFQFVLADLYAMVDQSILPYYMTRQHLELLQQVLVGRKPIRFNRHTNKLYLDLNWKKVQVGQYFIVEAYQVLDPIEYSDVWGDRWLARYATQLIKKQWGDNLKKYSEMTLPGGARFNGQQIYDEAEKELIRLEEEMINSYSLPISVYVG